MKQAPADRFNLSRLPRYVHTGDILVFPDYDSQYYQLLADTVKPLFTAPKLKEPLIDSGRSRLRSKIFRFEAQIARNSELLRRFATKKLSILGVRYAFMN